MRVSDAAAKRRQIMDATCRLLVKRGFQDIVLDDVAHEAKVAKGTLFLYYKSKDDLLSSAYAELVDQLDRSLAALPQSGREGLPLLTEAIRTILIHLERKHDFLSQFSLGKFPACGFKSQAMLMKKFRKNSQHLISILQACGADGSIRACDYSFAAFALMGLCRSAMLRRITMKSKGPLEEEVRNVLHFFLHGAAGGIGT